MISWQKHSLVQLEGSLPVLPRHSCLEVVEIAADQVQVEADGLAASNDEASAQTRPKAMQGLIERISSPPLIGVRPEKATKLLSTAARPLTSNDQIGEQPKQLAARCQVRRDRAVGAVQFDRAECPKFDHCDGARD